MKNHGLFGGGECEVDSFGVVEKGKHLIFCFFLKQITLYDIWLLTQVLLFRDFVMRCIEKNQLTVGTSGGRKCCNSLRYMKP